MIAAGERYGTVVVVADTGRRKKRERLWLCRCDCGKEFEFTAWQVTSRKRTKCTHVDRGGDCRHPARRCWEAMIKRCHNKNYHKYQDYGGRGIRVYDAWRKNFTAFAEHIGPRPSLRHSVDRINVNGNYEPGNVRWATPSQQRRNSRDNLYVEWDGKRILFCELPRHPQLSYDVAKQRHFKLRWPLKRALQQPPRDYRRSIP